MGLASSSPIDADGLINTDGSSLSGSLSVSAQGGSSIDTTSDDISTVDTTTARPSRRSAPARVFTAALPSGTALIIDPRCLLHVTSMPKFERPARLWG